MFRFSIRALLMALFLIAGILAALTAERPGERLQRVASIAPSPNGKQFAVSLLECNGFNEEDPTVLHRTISLVEFPSLRTSSVVRRDRQTGGNTDNYVFWHQQSAVKYCEDHLLFLNRQNDTLLAAQISSGSVKDCARFIDSEILSFDASADGSLIVVHGNIRQPGPEGEEISIDGETFIMPETTGALGMYKKVEEPNRSLFIYSLLGIAEPETIVIPLPDQDDDVEGSDAASTDEEITTDGWREISPFTSTRLQFAMPNNDKVFPLRAVVVPGNKEQAGDPDNIGFVGGAFSMELDTDSLKPHDLSEIPSNAKRWRMPPYDVATSQGKCRFAKLLPRDQLLLNVTTDDQSGFVGSVEMKFNCSTNPESVVAMSTTGTMVAATDGQNIRLLEIPDPIATYHDVIASELKLFAFASIGDHPHETWKHDGVVTAMAFSQDQKHLIIGDDQGKLSIYEIDTGNIVKQTGALGKRQGAPIYVVVLIFIVWLWCASSMMISWLKSRQEQAEVASDGTE